MPHRMEDMKIETRIAQILVATLNEPIGLCVATNDPRILRTRIYQVRKKMLDVQPDLKHIAVYTSPKNPEGELWLLNKGDDNAPEVSGP